MDIQYFINIIWRRRWLILVGVLVPAIATFLFMSRLKETYKANSILALSAGTVDYTGLDLRGDNPFIQQFQLESGFESLKTLMYSRPSVKLLTYILLLHDLDATSHSKTPPFRQPDEKADLQTSQVQLDHVIAEIKRRLAELDISAENEAIDLMIDEYAKAYGYDYKTLTEDHLTIERIGETATIKVEFTAENAELCSFAVNQFSRIFKEYRQSLTTSKDKSSVEFYKEQMQGYKDELDQKMEKLNQFLKEGDIVDLEAESKSIVSQISELELALEQERKKIPALEESIKVYNGYLRGLGTETGILLANKDAVDLNTRPNIINLRNSIQRLQTQLIEKGEEDKTLQSRIDLTKRQLEAEIKKLAGEMSSTKNDDLGAREVNERERSLLEKRIDAESDLILARESEKSLEKELRRLRARKSSLVTKEAYLDNLKGEKAIALDQYTEAVTKFSQADESYRGNIDPLSIIELAKTPEEPEPANKVLFASFAGVVGGSITTLFIFLLAFFDMSMNTPEKFVKFTNLPLLGTLNKLRNNKNLNVNELFASGTQNKDLTTFKESIRNLRYAIENSNEPAILFTSTKENEGKTFLMLNLAFALQLKNKKILLVDTNFKDNYLTGASNGQGKAGISSLIKEYQLESVFNSGVINKEFNIENIEVLRNIGTNLSPSEVFAGKNFNTFLDKLTLQYDYIFLEGPSLNQYTDTKELAEYADKVIAVFSAESELKSSDKSSIDFLHGLGNKFLGAVLNKIDLRDLD